MSASRILSGKSFDLRPAAIIRDLDLRRPIYKQTAAYGHFGRPDLDLPWEKTDKVDQLRKKVEGGRRYRRERISPSHFFYR
ncbi:MAG: methionine adenosyltransferase domain-containing protein [Clostridia bacterium]